MEWIELTDRKGQELPELWLLHGYGSHEGDLFALSPALEEFEIRALRAPIDIIPTGHAWYSLSFDHVGMKTEDLGEAAGSLEMLIDALNEHQLKHPERQRPYILGFSQGGILANALAWKRPDLVSAVVSICSYMPWNWPFLMDHTPGELCPVYGAFGTHDGVIQPEISIKSYEILEERNPDLVWKGYPMAHTIHPSAFQDVKTWLLAQASSATP